MTQYDQLTRGWRLAYGVLGTFFLIGGGLGAVGEVIWAIHGYPLAWVAAAMAVAAACLGAFLLRAVRRGRIRGLGLGSTSRGS